jgi:hypothetical protein
MNYTSDEVNKAANASFSSLQNRVIMPNGSLFNFTGIDVDRDGNMFTHVSYALGADGVNQAEAAS